MKLITILVLFIALGACTNRDETTQTGERETHTRHESSAEPTKLTVRLSSAAISRMEIRTDTAVSLAASNALEVPAELQAEPDRVAHVSSVVSGQISKVFVTVGSRVKAGQELASLRSVALGDARAKIARSAANLEVARANFKRQQELQSEGIGSKRQYLEAQATLRRANAEQSAARQAIEVYGRGGQGSEIKIQSPISGQVIERHATVGEVVGPGEVLFNVTDISQVLAVGRVYQKDAGQIKEGAPVLLTLQALPERVFNGQLDYVAPALDEQTRTLPVHVRLANPEALLRPGLFGTLAIGADPHNGPKLAAVTRKAVQKIDGKSVVFVPEEDPHAFRAVEVTVQSRNRGFTILKTGLVVGDRYVADGAFALKSELSRDDLGEGDAH